MTLLRIIGILVLAAAIGGWSHGLSTGTPPPAGCNGTISFSNGCPLPMFGGL